jgi:hypothetical protein
MRYSKCVDYRPDLWHCFLVIIRSDSFRGNLHWECSVESKGITGRKKRLLSHGAKYTVKLRLSMANSSIFIQILPQPSTGHWWSSLWIWKNLRRNCDAFQYADWWHSSCKYSPICCLVFNRHGTNRVMQETLKQELKLSPALIKCVGK